MTQSVHPPPNPGRSIFGKWNFFIFHFFLGRRIFFHKVIQVWEFPSNFISRYDWIQFIWKNVILSSVMWKPSIYGCFIEIKWITFSTWRKPSDPSFVGASSYNFFKMTPNFNSDWKEHGKCLRVFSTFDFLHFFQIWCSLEKQKYGFVLTRGKNILSLIIETWRIYITHRSIFTWKYDF